uniref:Uncharacterized protein n=1 Tax=Kalanchoe fedtschenkoi TaxID=63787 RepID=A0A7N0US90_KALFE
MSSIIVLRKSEDSSAVGFSLWVDKIKGVENQAGMGVVGNKKVAGKNPKQAKPDQGEPKKKLCMCSPTNHPGSFRCRYHRSTPVCNLKPVDQNGDVTRDVLKLKIMTAKPTSAGAKPPLSRFSKAAAAVASELPR